MFTAATHTIYSMSSETRAADFFERYYIWRDTTGSLNKGFNMSVSLSRPVDDALLSQALRATVLAHPQLLLHLKRNKDKDEADAQAADAQANGLNYVVGLISHLAFADVVRHTTTALDDAELTRLADVRTACDASTPSWYLQVSSTPESQYLTFACNHVFFDGKSAVHFFDDLVGALAKASEVKEPLPFVDILYDPKIDSVVVPPSSSSVVDLFDSPWWYIAKQLAARVVPTVVRLAITRYYSGPDLTSNPIFNVQPFCATNISRFHCVHLDAEELTALLARCRAVGATMAPFLAASACSALDQSVVAAIGGSHTHVTQLIVCGRRFYPHMADKVRYGLYVSVAQDAVKSGLPVASTAATLSRNLSALLYDRSRFWLVGLLRYVNIWAHTQEKFDKKEVRNTVEVSNVGLVRIEHGQWAVEDYVFSQGITTSHLTLSVASTPKGGMNIVISSIDSLHEYEVDGVNAMSIFYDTFAKTVKCGE